MRAKIFGTLLCGAIGLCASDLRAQGHTREPLAGRAHTRWAQLGREALRGNSARLAAGPLRNNILLGSLATVSGTLRQVLIPLAFSNQSNVVSASDLGALYYGPGSSLEESVSSYYSQVSGGRFQIQGQATGVVTLPYTGAAYVGARRNGVADSLAAFVRDALTRADSGTDWTTAADTSDPLLRVPVVVLVQPGEGGECSNPSGVWSHRYTVTDLLGGPYVTHSLIGGRHVVIDDYIVTSALDCSGKTNGVGPVAHETGHLLGLPDLYDTSAPTSTGPVGDWDLMGTGNYNTPHTPAWLGAWTRAGLGWSPLQVDTAGSLTLGAAETGGPVVIVPFGSQGEALLIENRQALKSDIALHGTGIIIWTIDAARLDQGHLDKNTVNNGGIGVGVVQADGRRDLEGGTNDGDAGDVWVNGTYGPQSVPAWTSRTTGQAMGIVTISGSTAAVTRAVGSAATGRGILPDTLPRAVAGLAYRASFRLAGTDTSSQVTWVIDTVALARAGLRDSIQGGVVIVQGTVADSAATVRLAISALLASSTGTGTDSTSAMVTLPILSNPHLGLDRIAQALLGGTALGSDEAAFYDARGNSNGVFDLGDVARAVSSGIVPLDAKSALAKILAATLNVSPVSERR